MLRPGIFVVAVLFSAACSSPEQRPSSAARTDKVPESDEGSASYVAADLHGKRTASGVPFDSNGLVAAHPSYPFGTQVRVTNLTNGKAVTVRIVDRGPVGEARSEGVIIDLSKAAAEALGFVDEGRARVRVEILRAAGEGKD